MFYRFNQLPRPWILRVNKLLKFMWLHTSLGFESFQYGMRCRYRSRAAVRYANTGWNLTDIALKTALSITCFTYAHKETDRFLDSGWNHTFTEHRIYSVHNIFSHSASDKINFFFLSGFRNISPLLYCTDSIPFVFQSFAKLDYSTTK
jgi:hypothetical protein